ncbi:unnamed protein product [Owenia fusiformis]|uniref:Uncharacterized protein n=1 Tax=Owenia fusiformis TaxID=6347 RepID=A0A8S4Q7Y2_OWEFU|nr:unnamed protein product [Owenia fusiformis]
MAFSAGKGHKYYVWYMGWKECRSLRGQDDIIPVAKALVSRRSTNDVPTLTLEFAKKELKITQEKEKRKGKIEKIKYPSIPTKDITFSCKVYDDVVGCVYLGFNPKTQCAVHVHVYRFDSGATADSFLRDTRAIFESSANRERLRKVEEELLASGQIDATRLRRREQASVPIVPKSYMENEPLSRGEYRREIRHSRQSSGSNEDQDRRSDSIGGETEQYPDEKDLAFLSVNDELRAKLKLDTAPILLPPKDYDTVRRKHGDLEGIEERKSQQKPIVGDRGALFSEDYPQRSNQQHAYAGNIKFTSPKLAIKKRDSFESGQDSGIGGPNEIPSPSSDHSNQGFPDRDLGQEIRYDDNEKEPDLKMVTPVWKKPDMYRYPTAQSSLQATTGAHVQDETPASPSRRGSQGSSVHSAQGSHYSGGKPASRNASFKSDTSGEYVRHGYSTPRNAPARNSATFGVGDPATGGNIQVNNSKRRSSNSSGHSGENSITHYSNHDNNERPHNRSLSEQHDYRYVQTKASAEMPDQRYLVAKDRRSATGEKPDPRYLEPNRKHSSDAGIYSYYK